LKELRFELAEGFRPDKLRVLVGDRKAPARFDLRKGVLRVHLADKVSVAAGSSLTVEIDLANIEPAEPSEPGDLPAQTL
jgi:hypothetical protein